jgi:hypothetical protein
MRNFWAASLIDQIRRESQENGNSDSVDSLQKVNEFSDKQSPLKVTLIQPTKGKQWKKAGTTDSGLYHEFLTKNLDYGGTQETVPFGSDGQSSQSTKQYYYAPGSNGITGETLDTTYNDDYSKDFPVESDRFTQHDPDTNFTQKNRPRIAPKNDKDIRIDTKHPSGRSEGEAYIDRELGNVIWPLTGSLFMQAIDDEQVLKISDGDSGEVEVTYEYQPKAKKIPESGYRTHYWVNLLDH